MRFQFAIFLLLGSTSFAQETDPLYTWDELGQLAHDPDTIYAISFRKMKLDELPTELYRYKNLRQLDLSKNNLISLPDELTTLEKLNSIDLERNKFESFPLQFCRMPQLVKINLGLNEVGNVPRCIEGIESLEKLYLYDNPITSLPDEIENLKNLSYLDLSGIRFSPEFQESWLKRLPNIRLDFDAPCDCMK